MLPTRQAYPWDLELSPCQSTPLRGLKIRTRVTSTFSGSPSSPASTLFTEGTSPTSEPSRSLAARLAFESGYSLQSNVSDDGLLGKPHFFPATTAGASNPYDWPPFHDHPTLPPHSSGEEYSLRQNHDFYRPENLPSPNPAAQPQPFRGHFALPLVMPSRSARTPNLETPSRTLFVPPSFDSSYGDGSKHPMLANLRPPLEAFASPTPAARALPKLPALAVPPVQKRKRGDESEEEDDQRQDGPRDLSRNRQLSFVTTLEVDMTRRQRELNATQQVRRYRCLN